MFNDNIDKFIVSSTENGKIFATFEAADNYCKAFEAYYKTVRSNRNENTFTINEIAERLGINAKNLHIIISNDDLTEVLNRSKYIHD